MNGTRLEGKAEVLPRGARLKPLRDRLVVKPLDWAPSSIIEVAGGTRKTLRGRVIAVGPGTYHREYFYKTMPDGTRQKNSFKDSHRRVPMDVKVGDVVELGGLEIDGYLFPEIIIGTERHIICQQQDVVGVHG